MRFFFLASLVFLLFFNGTSVFKVDGYRPVYVPKEEAKEIKVFPPRDVTTQGKIYVTDNYIFVGDVNFGVHVINNSNPLHPQKIAFIQIYGNHDIAVKGNVLYADNMEDLVALDISDIQNIQLTKRIPDVYKIPNQHFPENLPFRTYFECPDPSNGYIVGWIPGTIENPKCYTSY